MYTNEQNVQMVIYLMKEHGIKKVIASPGTTNVTLVASIQRDPWFEIYSAADERSAAYMACGLAAESGEPVALSCTGATASRNYIPALTEAFYRKLPVIAITSTQHTGRIGQLAPQVIDRSKIQNDIAVYSVNIPSIRSSEDEWDCNIKINTALLALKHRGGGPVHINLTTTYSRDFSFKELPETRVIHRFTYNDELPKINADKIGIFVGAHTKWTDELTKAVDKFCEVYNAVVFCDHTSNYHGKYRVQFSLIAAQSMHKTDLKNIDLLIDMGEMSGAYMSISPKKVWRVNPDGVIRDTFRKLENIFDMEEIDFFKLYANNKDISIQDDLLINEYKKEYSDILSKMPDLPFSNAWIAKQTTKLLPENSILHLGILNSLRNWNFFEISQTIDCYSNTGGFGIDGIVSTIVGASLADRNKLHFCVVGDLAFFYDLNSLGNHNIGNNLRILLINNGCGTEFKNYSHFAAQFGEEANEYMAAQGHYGYKSKELVKHYATDLGFMYLSASNKDEYMANLKSFVNQDIGDKPIVFEVFTNSQDESDALRAINQIIVDPPTTKDKLKSVAKNVVGDKGVKALKKIVKG
ncbi:MAG: thiamine pyrophosphate-binding protein [Lachnospirales bacterium]